MAKNHEDVPTAEEVPIADAQWVQISKDGNYGRTERMRVPGGWLYRSWFWKDNGDAVMAMVFAPLSDENVIHVVADAEE